MLLRLVLQVFIFVFLYNSVSAQQHAGKFFAASDPLIQYVGRIDASNPEALRFWQPGVYIKAKFYGTYCELHINDEELWGKSHNYISIIVDDNAPIRLQTKGKKNVIDTVRNLLKGEHTIVICKNTEAGIGYLEFVGLKCEKLLRLPNKPSRKIEFIGNSITCGMGSDLSVIPCDSGQWYDQHNAYLSYGAQTARRLNAQWHLSSVSGIGLIRSCCNMEITMPDVFDKINMRDDTILWDFKKYQPEVVSICLGQNDRIQDSVKFCSAYVSFIKNIRTLYPRAQILCITSPMADEKLAEVMRRYLTGVVSHLQSNGEKKVDKYFFSRSFNNGCGSHPDLQDHTLIANELTAKIKSLMGW
ncbi:SGNH/GDSL hydrolase family protein [Chryseosolibacter indicus]|uniref:SGNH/GDSL hydrolase family protein n=1 Tax=Chryseosolibacter indicus TaxID=2782351 RepID=A0ABS5VLA9_9BACT|nr:SGNH/GDSL hydrolase family protein [Chryseosolibacter indicus]MBT1702240.1 SGNH/GDSL hydrolase family protein [Chryseosolibacter indicus]